MKKRFIRLTHYKEGTLVIANVKKILGAYTDTDGTTVVMTQGRYGRLYVKESVETVENLIATTQSSKLQCQCPHLRKEKKK